MLSYSTVYIVYTSPHIAAVKILHLYFTVILVRNKPQSKALEVAGEQKRRSEESLPGFKKSPAFGDMQFWSSLRIQYQFSICNAQIFRLSFILSLHSLQFTYSGTYLWVSIDSQWLLSWLKSCSELRTLITVFIDTPRPDTKNNISVTLSQWNILQLLL